MAVHGDKAGREDKRVIDLDRAARPGEPPVPGAQWDELHSRWERWDEVDQRWVILGDDGRVAGGESSMNRIPALLARELLRPPPATDDDAEPKIIDIDRLATPKQAVPGAQWNEVHGRWERWDDAASAWVEVPI